MILMFSVFQAKPIVGDDADNRWMSKVNTQMIDYPCRSYDRRTNHIYHHYGAEVDKKKWGGRAIARLNCDSLR